MIRTIIIDDEILARIGIQTFLEGKQDIAVQGTFSSSLDALGYLRGENQVDIVITDIEMPDMDGLAFIKAVREENLCAGIIIVSCHDNFSYAREALELGADSYILKQEVTEEKLNEVIEKINGEKILPMLAEKNRKEKGRGTQDGQVCSSSYVTGVLKLQSRDSADDSLISGHVDKTMLIHLLENIVEKEGMGTFFSPYNKEMFILFQFPQEQSCEEKAEQLKKNCDDLNQNVKLFINERLLIGCSGFFDELKDMRERYQEGLNMLRQDFYESGEYFFVADSCLRRKKEVFRPDTEQFTEEEWIGEFCRQLTVYIDNCRDRKEDPDNVKKELFHVMNRFIYTLAQKYSLAGQLILGFGGKLEGIMDASSRSRLEYELTEKMQELSSALRKRLADDTMESVLQYLEEHIYEQIPLTEAAQKSFMSVPHFCKRFKEYTGETYVKYVNNRRVEKIKEYLDCGKYSLNEIACMMNFQNMNYMIRLFKSTTGLTIREYKRSAKKREE